MTRTINNRQVTLPDIDRPYTSDKEPIMLGETVVLMNGSRMVVRGQVVEHYVGSFCVVRDDEDGSLWVAWGFTHFDGHYQTSSFRRK